MSYEQPVIRALPAVNYVHVAVTEIDAFTLYLNVAGNLKTSQRSAEAFY